ncbi:MAG: ABC-2 type transport system permease protein [Alcanivorax sp.]|jgi:ABC-2 type transport system permease protein
MQVLVFGLAATLEVRNINVAVYNEDVGRTSYELVARMAVAEFVDKIIYVDSTALLEELIDSRSVLLAMHFPSEFSRHAAIGLDPEFQVIADGRRANAVQVTLGYVSQISSQLSLEMAVGTGVASKLPRPVIRHWFNPNLEYRWFMIPSMVAILSLTFTLMLSALSIARERELGTFDQLLVSPAGPVEITVSKSIPALMAGLTIGTVTVLVCILGFRVPFEGSFLVLYSSMTVFALSVLGLGLMISAFAETQQQAYLGLFFFQVPIILISGFATPVENMPQWLQYVAELSPMKHFLIIVQGSFLKGISFAEAWPHIWPLLLIAAVGLTAATLVIKHRLH